MKLTAKHVNSTIVVKLSEDATMGQVFDAFRTLAIGMSFHEESFMDAVLTFVDENTIGGIKNAKVPN